MLCAGAPPVAKKYASIRPGAKATKAHPLANLGGYQMPMVGKIGGNSGVVSQKGSLSNSKRPREDQGAATGGSKKPVSKEEEEALARREAARARVQQRTMAAFGLK